MANNNIEKPLMALTTYYFEIPLSDDEVLTTKTIYQDGATTKLSIHAFVYGFLGQIKQASEVPLRVYALMIKDKK